MERIIAFSASTSSGRARPGRTMASSKAQKQLLSQPFQPHDSSCRRPVSARRRRPPDPGRADLFPIEPGQKRHQLGVVEAHARGRYRRPRSAEHTSELQSLMRLSYVVFCLKKKNTKQLNLKYVAVPP